MAKILLGVCVWVCVWFYTSPSAICIPVQAICGRIEPLYGFPFSSVALPVAFPFRLFKEWLLLMISWATPDKLHQTPCYIKYYSEEYAIPSSIFVPFLTCPATKENQMIVYIRVRKTGGTVSGWVTFQLQSIMYLLISGNFSTARSSHTLWVKHLQ